MYQRKLDDWEKKKRLRPESWKVYTFGELLEWYLAHPKTKGKKTYNRDLEMAGVLRKQFGKKLANEIKPTDIESFQARMLTTLSKRGTPYKPATVNRFVTLLKRMYNLAVRDDLVEKNPCWKVSFLPERNARGRVASPEELEALMKELPEYSLILTIGYYLGMREGEILALRRKQVHFYEDKPDEGFIELRDGETKTGEGRRVPFGVEVGAPLRQWMSGRKGKPDGLLFVTRNGKYLGNFRRAFRRACRRVGIKGLWFHDFRHTAVTNMRKADVDTTVIMAISGHKTMAMFNRYNRVDLEDGSIAMKKLQAYLAKNEEKGNKIDLGLTLGFQDGNAASA
jgi:integrase